MKILSIECSAVPCSACVSEGDMVLSADFMNVGLTHSQTLMPMVEKVLKEANISISDIDGFGVSAGPGSFTGIRIGISAIKGMATPLNKPCFPVSTLFAMAQNYRDTDCIVCAVMDARCNQVYNANFEILDGNITRLCEDRALLCEELAKEIKNISQNEIKCVIIVGDGANLFYEFVKDFENVSKAEEDKMYQNAIGVALAIKDSVEPKELLPVYLRLPQAERELKLKRSNEK